MTVKDRTRAAVAFALTKPNAGRCRSNLNGTKGNKGNRRRRVFERDGHRCVYCSATHGLTIDHIVPLCKGGTNADVNLATVCQQCNSDKGDHIIFTPRADVAARSFAPS